MPTSVPPPSRPALRGRCVPVLVAGVLLTSSACASSGTARDVAAPGPDGGTHAHSTAPAAVPAVVPARGAPRAQAAPTDAVQLRSDLERLLGAHVLLADELVRARTAGQPARVTALAGSVDRNQAELAAAVSALAGPQAGESFAQVWSEHVDVLAAYATALVEGDRTAQSALRTRYTGIEQRLGGALSAVAGNSVPRSAVQAAAAEHGEHLLDQADASAAGAHDTAFSVQRTAFGHMIMVADVLARGAATAKGLPTAELDAPRRQLQTALSRLLAEHMGLMVQAMRAAQDRSPDFGAAGRAVNANTTDLGGAVATLYGKPASDQFLAVWGDHVEALIAYAGTQEQAARDDARSRGVDYAPRLARFLAGATEQRLPAIELASALTQHDDHLRRQLDAYAEDDLDEAQAQAEQGYTHMFELASALAVAVGDTVAAKLPSGGAATGGGGLAGGR